MLPIKWEKSASLTKGVQVTQAGSNKEEKSSEQSMQNTAIVLSMNDNGNKKVNQNISKADNNTADLN